MSTKKQNNLLTPAEVANLLGVSPITVRSWVQKGWLSSRVTPGGHRRFLMEDVEKLMDSSKLDDKSKILSKVLVVDDEEVFLKYLVEAISLLAPDIEIREARDGFQAGIAIAEFRPELVLLDYAIPGMDGAALCRLIKEDESYSSCKVVAVTGHATPDIEKSLLAAGADKVLFKPFPPSEIEKMIKGYNECLLE